MSTALSVNESTAELLERVVIGGDLSKLSATDRMQYYREVCASIGLNPLTKPFEYIQLSGKLTLYARRDATDQLRKLHSVSVQITAREQHGDVYAVSARAVDKTGRTDESVGAVPTQGLRGEALANALMKAETKAKRRVTLSICGLGMLDETELETIPASSLKVLPVEATVPILPPAEAAETEPESGRSEVPAKVPVKDWLDSFEVVKTVKAAQALWSGFNNPETKNQYTEDEFAQVFDAKESSKVRLGAA
jgi:hypothetical protein